MVVSGFWNVSRLILMLVSMFVGYLIHHLWLPKDRKKEGRDTRSCTISIELPNVTTSWVFLLKINTRVEKKITFKPLDIYLFIFKYILLIMLLQLSHFPPFTPSCTPLPSHFPPYSSCPWVINISSLASTFPILFLSSPCLFSTYHLCYLFSVPFLPLSPSHSPVDNPPCDLHFCGSVPVLVVCFCFCFRCGC